MPPEKEWFCNACLGAQPTPERTPSSCPQEAPQTPEAKPQTPKGALLTRLPGPLRAAQTLLQSPLKTEFQSFEGEPSPLRGIPPAGGKAGEGLQGPVVLPGDCGGPAGAAASVAVARGLGSAECCDRLIGAAVGRAPAHTGCGALSAREATTAGLSHVTGGCAAPIAAAASRGTSPGACASPGAAAARAAGPVLAFDGSCQQGDANLRGAAALGGHGGDGDGAPSVTMATAFAVGPLPAPAGHGRPSGPTTLGGCGSPGAIPSVAAMVDGSRPASGSFGRPRGVTVFDGCGPPGRAAEMLAGVAPGPVRGPSCEDVIVISSDDEDAVGPCCAASASLLGAPVPRKCRSRRNTEAFPKAEVRRVAGS